MRIGTVTVIALVVAGLSTSPAAARGNGPGAMARGRRISGVVRFRPAAAVSAKTTRPASCRKPGRGNYRTDCDSTGRPVNETWIVHDPVTGTYYAAANDYNSYNGYSQDGFFWSSNAMTWKDAGPLDLFPRSAENAAGDPGLAVDGSGVVYYSSLFFNYSSCYVGGLELSRRDPATGSWSSYQIAANSSAQFQDKPAVAVSGSNVYVSWTQYASCSGAGVASPIKVAVLPSGADSAAPSAILSVPGSTYSQGSSIGPDGAGGLWIAWEEFPSATARIGSIELAHYDGTSWSTPQTISPSGFTDLPSPLSGFRFRTDSFPALTVANGSPAVVWTSYDSGAGRAYLWRGGTLTELAPSGGDQFFPSIAPDGSGGVSVAYSQVDAGQGAYDQWLWHDGTVTKVSTASSDPNQDQFFAGGFIGDYSGLAYDGSQPLPIWTDIRGPDRSFAGWKMDSMVAAQR